MIDELNALQHLIDPDEPADDAHDLESAAGAEPIDLAPTWMVTATEDVLRLVQMETGIPRKTIPRRYMDALAVRLTVRRRVFMGDEPLSPVILRVKRELVSFGQPEVSGPFAGTPG